MKYFITGTNGLVGSFIARALLNHGFQVKGLIRKGSDKSLIKDIESKIEWIEGNLLDITTYARELSDVDIVIHAAAIVSFYPANYDEMYKVNVEGTNNIVNSALAQGVGKFILISSVATLGKSKNMQVIDESSNWENSTHTSVYANTKYLAELAVWRGMQEGLQVLILNPSIVLGPGNWNTGSSRLFKYVWNNNWFYPSGFINYIDVRDIAEILVQMLKTNIANEKFLLNGGKLLFKDFFAKTASYFNKREPFLPVTPWIIEIGWRIAWLFSLFSPNEPFITKETARAAKRSYTYDTKKLNYLLNFKYKNLDETLAWVTQNLEKK